MKCDPEIYKSGEYVLMVSGPRSSTMEEWVRLVSRVSGQRVDWHCYAGRDVVLYIGDRARVVEACRNLRVVLDEMYEDCDSNWFPKGHPGEYVQACWLTEEGGMREPL